MIKMLSRDADEADEQYNMALRTHLHNVDRLVGKQTKKIVVSIDAFLELQAVTLTRPAPVWVNCDA